MKTIPEAMKAYLETHPFDPGDDDCVTVLDQLYLAYANAHESDPPEISEGFKKLEEFLDTLPLVDNNAAYDKKDQAISLIDKLITEMTGEEAAEEVRETLNQISDIKISQTVNKDGYISAGDMEYAFAVEGVSGADSVDLNLEFDMSLTLNNPGEPVEVTPMDGYESFEEVSPNEDMLEDFVPVM